MGVADSGFRHIGRCENLEGLWYMYCQDTGDAATVHIASLRNYRATMWGKQRSQIEV